MSQYVVINDNKIVELYDAIPQNWKNISGFNLLNDKQREDCGFFKVEQPSQEYNPVKHNLISRDIKLNEQGLPYVNLIVEDKINDVEYQEFLYNESMSILRNIRDSYLNASDWALATDVVELKGEEWKNAWLDYRKKLRDLTESFKNDKTVFDPQKVPLPIKPNI